MVMVVILLTGYIYHFTPSTPHHMQSTPAPIPLTPQERIEDTLLILNITAFRNYHLLSNCIKVYDESSDNITEAQLALITGVRLFGIIQFSAFLDEWNRQFLQLKVDGIEADRVEKVERIAKPALDILDLYPSIRDMRNSVLAHNSRTRLTQRSPYLNAYRGNLISTFVTPASISEFMLLAATCLEIAQVAREEFAEYYIEPEDFMSQYTIPNVVIPRTNTECYTLHTDMLAQIAALKQSENN
jgi:hypothetical protein